MNSTAPRIAGHAIVEQLVAFGVDRVFGVPGESYLDVLDGLYEHSDQIEMVVTRQEGGAAIMAATHGQITGTPGVCLVTRGPGATNASIGVHIASQDASPMILLIGQIPRRVEGRHAFQEVDYQAMFGSIAKEVLEINLPQRAPEIIARALTVAVSGQPGPVVVVLPEDVLLEETDAPIIPKHPRPVPQPEVAAVERAVVLLSTAKTPLIVAGDIGWNAEARELLTSFAERSHIPVVTTARRQDVVDNDSPAYVGTLGLRTTIGLDQRVAEADTVVFLATRADPLTLANADLHFASNPCRRYVHVYPDADSIGMVYPADVPIVSAPLPFLCALPEQIAPRPERDDWFNRMQQGYVEALQAAAQEEPAASYMGVFDTHFGPDTVITVGAGNYTGFAQRHHRYGRYRSQLGSLSGAMGVGIPAATAAAFAMPDRDVVAFAGDGCFLMNSQELSTISRYGLNVLVLVINNSVYGTIREHQQRRYPGRPSGTDLENPDFVKLAGAYGARAARVTTPDEFDAALAELAQAKGLRLIEIDITEGQEQQT
ncbi:MAG: thiamine pyrophosphate-dependent enzyme [Microbacterium sp.]